MRMASVQLIGPMGQPVELHATGEGELIVEERGGPNTEGCLIVRDTGLPAHPEVNGQQPARIVARVPLSWAFFPGWEFTEPLHVPAGT